MTQAAPQRVDSFDLGDLGAEPRSPVPGQGSPNGGLEHYIPLRKRDIVELLATDRGLSRSESEAFRKLAEIISATFHFEYHQLLEELKADYAPFDPDATTKTVFPVPQGQLPGKLDSLFAKLVGLMERANFKHLTRADLEQAFRECSDWGLYMDVDLSLFERLELFARGQGVSVRKVRRWQNLFRAVEVRTPILERLVVCIKLKPSKRLPADVDTSDVYLKIFKDIPKGDIEMLLPGARTRMPIFEQWKLSGSILGGVVGVLYSFGKDLLDLALNATLLSSKIVFGPVVALFGLGYRQYFGYVSKKNSFNLRLANSLYYQTLGSNQGVLHHLLDEAEEQECRETLLAYFYLWRFAGDNGWTANDLDNYIEMDLERMANVKVDFEIDDALVKLERLQMAVRRKHPSGDASLDRFVAMPIDKAYAAIDYVWDNYFQT